MLLKITTTHQPTTDLGYLLHKHPDKFQSFELSVGEAHVFYPEVSIERTSICLMLDIDPIAMVRGGRNSNQNFVLGHYINDRPYVASSFMSVALSKAFSSALNGKCKDKPELVEVKLPLEIEISALPAPRGGEALIRKLFEPLGYEVELSRYELDPKFPEWGQSKYFTLMLRNSVTIKNLLSHLYVLIPTMDHDKHYYVNQQEIDKLLEKGEGWLKEHPAREMIIERYLLSFNFLSKQALERISDGEEIAQEEILVEASEVRQKKESLHETRLNLTAEKLLTSGAQKVLDMGCGEGKLIRKLIKNKQYTEIAGVDVSYNELLKAKERMNYDEMAPKQKERIKLFQGSLTYRDQRFEGFDAAAIVEVIEHLDINRLQAFERVVFEYAKPKTVVLTTPNKEYNIVWEKLPADEMRHSDHRFEWTRQEFADWAKNISQKYQYTVEFLPVGDEVELVGAPSQMAIFTYGN